MRWEGEDARGKEGGWHGGVGVTERRCVVASTLGTRQRNRRERGRTEKERESVWEGGEVGLVADQVYTICLLV